MGQPDPVTDFGNVPSASMIATCGDDKKGSLFPQVVGRFFHMRRPHFYDSFINLSDMSMASLSKKRREVHVD